MFRGPTALTLGPKAAHVGLTAVLGTSQLLPRALSCTTWLHSFSWTHSEAALGSAAAPLGPCSALPPWLWRLPSRSSALSWGASSSPSSRTPCLLSPWPPVRVGQWALGQAECSSSSYCGCVVACLLLQVACEGDVGPVFQADRPRIGRATVPYLLAGTSSFPGAGRGGFPS